MRDLIITLMVFGAVPFILLRPQIGIVVWSWLAYMNPHRFTWGFAYDFPFSQVVAVATLIAFAFSKDKLRLPWTSLTIVWLLFVAWTNLTTAVAIYPDYAVEAWDRWMKVQLISFLTIMIMHSRQRLQLLVWTICLSLGFFGLKGGVFAIVTGGNYLVWGPAGSFIEDNNALALALVLVLPFMRYLQISYSQRWLRWGLIGLMGLSGLAILSTYSRGGMLGAAAMMIFLWLKSRHKLLVGVCIAAAALLALPFMPDQWFERMGTIETYEQDGSALSRINSWWFAFYLALDNPITGGGFDTFTPELFWRYAPDPDVFGDAHSIYFEVLAEHGFLGLALFVAMGVLAYRTGSWIIRNSRTRAHLTWAKDLAAMVQVSLVAFAVAGAFQGLAYFDLYYHILAILVITRSLVEQSLAAETSAEPLRGSIHRQEAAARG